MLPEDVILVRAEGFQFGRWRAGAPDEEVLETYLAIACRRPLDARGRAALTKALASARDGDLALANIRLAHAGLSRAIAPHGLAERLAAAEWLLDCGVTPQRLLAELDLAGPGPVTKFDPSQPRVPAGSGLESGRWTRAFVVAASFLSESVGPRALAALSTLGTGLVAAAGAKAVFDTLFVPSDNTPQTKSGPLPGTIDPKTGKPFARALDGTIALDQTVIRSHAHRTFASRRRG